MVHDNIAKVKEELAKPTAYENLFHNAFGFEDQVVL